MKRIVIRILILFGVFVVSLGFFMMLLNRQDVISTKSMAQATLPVLTMREGERPVNRMFGYRQEVNETSLRDCLTLLPADRNLTVEMQSYENDVRSVDYQVTSLTDGSLVENGRVKSFEQKDGAQLAEFHINSAIRMGQEYMLRFALDIGEEAPVYYYTRIVQRSGQNLDWYLEYTEAFYQNCLNHNLTDEMISQLETESAQTNSSIHYVTLKSDQDQIAWGNLAPVLAKKAVPTILEINETTVSIRLDYLVSAADADGNAEYYTVREYYRMRKAQDQVVLLDFERTVDQYFDGNLPVLTESGLNLGIVGKDIDYVTNQTADIAAFEQAGELWLYDRSVNKTSRIFSFRGNDHSDERTENRACNISIASVSEEGDTTFIVYGYRSAGKHEGCLGISVYRYQAEDNTTNELLFIPLKDAFALEDQGLSRLAYVNSKDQCFLYYDETIYTIQLSDGSVVVLQEDLDWQTVSVSDSQMLVAWSEAGGENLSATIRILNLETGETVSISAPEGDYIKPLGYVGEDILYGLAHASDCYTDMTGNDVFPMYRICIRTQGGEMLKDYQMDGIYVTDVSIEDDLILLERETKEDGKRHPASADQLIHYAPEEGRDVDVKLVVTERKGTQVNLNFSVWGESSNLLTLYTRYPTEETDNRLEIPEMQYRSDYYSVYAKGGLYALYSRINQAIESADKAVGVVLNENQQYVWERGNTAASVMLEFSEIPQGLFSAPIEENAVDEAAGEAYNVWNLSGCSLSAVLYQISNGYAVIGQWSETQNLLLVGYDAYNVWYYDPATGEPAAIALEDAQNTFAAFGNIFISYHS